MTGADGRRSDGRRRLWAGLPMMLVGALLVLVVVPAAFEQQQWVARAIDARGIDVAPHFRGGTTVDALSDPTGDLLRPVGERPACPRCPRALDAKGFAVKTARVSPLAGGGIPARVNLCIDFPPPTEPADTPQPDDLPAINVLVDRHSMGEDDAWDLQVWLAAGAKSALILDGAGQRIGESVAVYVRSIDREPGTLPYVDADFEGFTSVPEGVRAQMLMSQRQYRFDQARIRRVIAALPMDLVGDPGEGGWRYRVEIGLPGEGGRFEVFDVIE